MTSWPHTTHLGLILHILAHDAFVRTNRHAIAMVFVYLSGMGAHCDSDHMVHFTMDLSLFQCSGHHDTKAGPPTPSRLFRVPPGRELGYACVNYVKH